MPIYVYRCEECGEVFEKLMSLSAANGKPPCPKCDSRRTAKQLAAVAAQTKSAASCGGGGKFT
ncbi:MAG: zinc ribbon domain-containing protein [Deltaproteobacteria bacterium]|nr:zinc ribbon domain-containing protein [Deltaproteobacteria bacterium]